MQNVPLIIMVHGGFHWGGCFIKVTNLLAERGYPVAAPDLCCHGHDTTPLWRIQTMADYVAPVERLVANAPRPVILVGHSMGGLTLNYLGERYAPNIEQLIYLAALMPARGNSLNDLDSVPSAASPLIQPLQTGHGMRIERDFAALREAFYGDCCERDVGIAVSNLSDNPLPPFKWASDVTPQNFGSIPRTYIETLHDRTLPIEAQRRFQTALPGAAIHTLDASHSPFSHGLSMWRT